MSVFLYFSFQTYEIQINIILVFLLFGRVPLPIRCRQAHQSEMSS